MPKVIIAAFVLFAASIVIACGGESSANATETATAQNQNALAATYELLLIEQISELNDSISRFIDLSNMDPSTANWRQMVEDELALWQSTATAARGLTPPDRYDELHATYVIAIDHFDQAADEILTGMQTGDEAMINAGMQSMLSGVDYINRTRDLVPDGS